MAYPYICPNCKRGEHESCEGARPVPQPESGELLGGGICVCPHDRVYDSPSDVWRAAKKKRG